MLIVFTTIGRLTFAATTPILELMRIYSAFDSLQYTKLKIDISLVSEVINGRSVNQFDAAEYMINGNDFCYKNGNNEFLQSDSLQIAAINDSRQLIIQKKPPKPASQLFGLVKPDELSSFYSTYYTLTLTYTDSTSALLMFTAINENNLPPSVPYSKISYLYDTATAFLQTATYEFKDELPLNEDLINTTDSSNNQVYNYDQPIAKFTLTMDFFLRPLDPDSLSIMLSPTRFVYFDGRKFRPATAYSSFDFYDELTGALPDDEADDTLQSNAPQN